MREFDVQITETLSKTVTVEAENLAEAEAVARQNWRKDEYILDADDFVGVEFEAIEPEREKVHPVSEKSWSDIFGTFDYTPYNAAQQAELKAAEEMGLPIQMYARPEYSAFELSQMREVFAKTAFVKAGPDAAYAEGLHPEPGFKDGYIYDNFPDKVCYIPEDWNFEEDGPGITANDILELCEGDKLKADIVFDMCEWEHPNTILVDWDKEQEDVLVEAVSNKLHVMYEATGDFLFEKASRTLDYYRTFGNDLFDLSVAIGEFVEDVDMGVIERLVQDGHNKDLVCDVLRCNSADFDKHGKYICGKEKASQPPNNDLEIKVVILEGAVNEVLKNQDIPVCVEVIDINKDYSDYEKLQEYRDEVYRDPSFKDCEYSVANFEGEAPCIPSNDSQPLNEQIRNAADRAGEGVNNTPPKEKSR